MPRNYRPKTNDATICIRMPSGLLGKLRKLATADQRPVSNYMVRVLTQHVEQLKGGK
jgi:predicted DNA-binding protein